MDSLERLLLLSVDMGYEPAEDHGCPQLDSLPAIPAASASPLPNRRVKNKPEKIVLSQAVLPNGKRIKLLKSLLTSACERDCYYCPFRAGRDFRRATFQPDEFARTIMSLHTAGQIQGAFLSSGIVAGGLRTQDKLLDTADILRHMGYRGYLHLKIMPGAERDQVRQAMRLADRVSINLEAPNSTRLQRLAPGKVFHEELLQPLRWVEEIRRRDPGRLGWNGHWPSSTTQFVVGGAGETDVELITASQSLYRNIRLARVYYSAFSPVADTPLEDQPPTPPIRELRLYQASFLLRDYGFDAEELPFNSDGSLPLGMDPKLAWAKQHLDQNPVEVNLASKIELLRIPGIGPKTAQAILQARRQQTLRDLNGLHRLGINAVRAAPFILLNGKRSARQLALF
jgi:predicted DNA-binding helix-hairpin-helix protein